MKVDITKRGLGDFLAACRAAVLAVGAMGLVPGSLAADVPAGLADPTRPSYASAVAEDTEQPTRGPVLQSTFVSASQRRAVIGGRSYSVGDKFDGAVIAEIEPYEVVLKQAGRETRLRLMPRLAKETHFVKVPANGQEGNNDK